MNHYTQLCASQVLYEKKIFLSSFFYKFDRVTIFFGKVTLYTVLCIVLYKKNENSFSLLTPTPPPPPQQPLLLLQLLLQQKCTHTHEHSLSVYASYYHFDDFVH